MSGFSFTCPFCNKPTTITDPNYFESWNYLKLAESTLGLVGLKISAITCPNEKCKKLFLQVDLKKADDSYYHLEEEEEIHIWKLLPESSAKPFPEFIPKAILNDYEEACRILNLSPKASATLARRCLQGMIRDFYKVKGKDLKEEINLIKDKVETPMWEGIEAVRSVGNIGAHMEKDINIIVDVEPEEAQLLIELIENLMVDWYINRHNRQENLKNLRSLAEKKSVQKKTTNKK